MTANSAQSHRPPRLRLIYRKMQVFLRGLIARSHRVVLGRRQTTLRVLFYAPSPLTEQYLTRVHRSISEYPCDFFFASHPGGFCPNGVTRVGIGVAPYLHWDIVIVANHHPLTFPPGPALLGVLHGIVRSRPVGLGSYWYDPSKMLDRRGRPVYAALFDASGLSRAEGEDFVPALRGRIQVVGDLRADDVLMAARAAPDRNQILVMSTWGPEALIPRHLDDLAPQLEAASRHLGLSVVVTSHPNLWQAQPHRGQRDYSQVIGALRDRGFAVLDPRADWAPVLGSSQITITDHTSLAAHFALLNRPILPVEVDRRMIGTETFTECLYGSVRPWGPDQSLVERLEQALAGGLPHRVHRAALARCDHRFEADARVSEEFSRLALQVTSSKSVRRKGSLRS